MSKLSSITLTGRYFNALSWCCALSFFRVTFVIVKRIITSVVCLLFFSACSRLPPLTNEVLIQAEQKWAMHRPDAYRLVIDMSGDRVETGRFEVQIRSNKVAGIRRNGVTISPNLGQDYSMEGLFHILEQELGLAEKPAMLGAPEGYTVYTNARFDDTTGRLIRYRRTVGGASNSIDINVLGFQPDSN